MNAEIKENYKKIIDKTDTLDALFARKPVALTAIYQAFMTKYMAECGDVETALNQLQAVIDLETQKAIAELEK